MKFNWGTGIVLAFVMFMSFIMYFVIKASNDKSLSHDLVTEDYYKQELKVQDEIDKLNNSKTLSENISLMKTEDGLMILFPESLTTNNISGKVFLYRPSNKHLDFETPISLSNHNLLIPKTRLLGGRWNIKVDWQYKGKSYLYKKEITY